MFDGDAVLMEQRVIPFAGRRGWTAAYEGAVSLFDGAQFKGFGQPRGPLWRARKSHDAACGGIQPLVNAQPFAALRFETFDESHGFAVGRMGGNAGRLVDDEKMIVLKKDGNIVHDWMSWQKETGRRRAVR